MLKDLEVVMVTEEEGKKEEGVGWFDPRFPNKIFVTEDMNILGPGRVIHELAHRITSHLSKKSRGKLLKIYAKAVNLLPYAELKALMSDKRFFISPYHFWSDDTNGPRYGCVSPYAVKTLSEFMSEAVSFMVTYSHTNRYAELLNSQWGDIYKETLDFAVEEGYINKTLFNQITQPSASSAIWKGVEEGLEEMQNIVMQWKDSVFATKPILILLDGDKSGIGKTTLAKAIDIGSRQNSKYYGTELKNLGLNLKQDVVVVYDWRFHGMFTRMRKNREFEKNLALYDLPVRVLISEHEDIEKYSHYGDFLKEYIKNLFSEMKKNNKEDRIVLWDEVGSGMYFSDAFKEQAPEKTLVIKANIKVEADTDERKMSIKTYFWDREFEKIKIEEVLHSSSGIGQRNTLEAIGEGRKKGGVDFNPANLNMDIRGAASSAVIGDMSIPREKVLWGVDLSNFQGFTFQIIKFNRNQSPESILYSSSEKELTQK